MREREIVFPKKKKKKIGKHPIENKPCFYQDFPLTKDSFPLTKFFFFFFFVLLNTRKCGKLSIQAVFQQNKQSDSSIHRLEKEIPWPPLSLLVAKLNKAFSQKYCSYQKYKKQIGNHMKIQEFFFFFFFGAGVQKFESEDLNTKYKILVNESSRK